MIKEIDWAGISFKMVQTGESNHKLIWLHGDEKTAKMFEEYIPTGGITDSEKMAQQVLYLCSPAADVITGDMLIADGGQWLVGNAFYQMGKKFLDD